MFTAITKSFDYSFVYRCICPPVIDYSKSDALRFTSSLFTLQASSSTSSTLHPNVAHQEDGLITGSTRGIGLALATHYTKAGWNVIGTARATSNTDKLLALSPFKIVTMDTSDEASVAEAVNHLQGVTIDLLINNAGTGWLTDIVPASKKLLMNAFEVNAVGPFLVTRALQPNLQLASKDHGFASVVQLSSLLGSLASNTEENAVFFRGQDAYSTSKAALNMVTRSFSVGLRENNIAVVAIHPGYVGTDLTAGQGPLNPADVATAIFDIVANLTLKDSGKFLNADPTMPGSELPW